MPLFSRTLFCNAPFLFIRDEDIEQMITWALKEANPVYPVPQVYTQEHFRRVIEEIRTKK